MKRLNIILAGLALVAGSALAQQVMQARNPKDQTLCMTASLGSIYWQKCQDGNTQQQIPVSIITLPATPAPVPSAPAPAPSAPTEPPKTTTPAGTPSVGVVPLFSTRYPDGVANANPHWGPYPSKAVGDLVVLNNYWGGWGKLAAGRQSMGAQSDRDGGVDVRAVFSFPGLTAGELAKRSEVTSYPSAILGQTPSGSPASPSRVLPRRIADIASAKYSYKASEGSATRGQHVSDIWITRAGQRPAAGNRLIEIMWLDRSFGGYNVPAAGAPGSAGRTAANLGTGPNPRAKITRETIGGRLVDVFDYAPGTWGGPHRLVKLIPVSMAQTGASAVDVLGIVDLMVARGHCTREDVLAAIEVGWEPVADRGATSGDVTMRGLRIEVQ